MLSVRNQVSFSLSLSHRDASFSITTFFAEAHKSQVFLRSLNSGPPPFNRVRLRVERVAGRGPIFSIVKVDSRESVESSQKKPEKLEIPLFSHPRLISAKEREEEEEGRPKCGEGPLLRAE